MSLKRMLIYIFVKDKFTDVLQPFVIPDFTCICTRIIHYFSCVTRNAPLPASCTKIKSPISTSPTAKLSSVISAISISLLHNHHYSILHMEFLKLPFRAVNSYQLPLQSFLLKSFLCIFFLPLLALWFSISVFSGVSVRILFFPCFLPSLFWVQL